MTFNLKFPERALITALSLIICSLQSALAQDTKLEGTVIGTENCYDYDTQAVSLTKNIPANAFDGDLSTFVATYDKSHTWVGLDLGTPHVITRVGWSPRNATSGPQRVLLGLFEASNREDFMDAIPLLMIKENGVIGTMSYADVNVSRGFRYVRYCGPSESRCNVAEIEFYGNEGEGDDSQFYQLSNLPTLSYHTYCGLEPYDKVTELESEMCLIYDEGTRIQEHPVVARERGNGSRDASFLKRPYRIKFNDGKSHHMLKGSPLESPAKCKKWTLLPNWREKSLIRNNIAFEMSRRLGLSYTPWCQNVDVIVNGEYKGNYQLCDQVTVDSCRVNVTEMTPEDVEEPNISGGYLVELDAYASSEPSNFTSNKGIPFTIKYPEDDEIVSAQKKYIKNAFNDLETNLWSYKYRDATEGYRSHLDLGSFLRQFLVSEFSGNTDAYYSVYMYKDRGDELFHVGPVWDFDLSMDNDRRVYPACDKSNWLFNYGSTANGAREFVNRILSDPSAVSELASIWSDMRESKAFSVESLNQFVDSLAQVNDESQKLNFTRWDVLGQLLTLQQAAPGTYQGEIDIIKNYLSNRISWIDNKLGYEHVEEVDPNDTLYVIKSAEGLLTFMRAVNKQGLTKLNARIESDLNLLNISARLEPIGTAEHPYEGIFDGQNHILSDLTIDRAGEDNVGLFGVVTAGAIIRGITLDSSCSLNGANNVALVATATGEGIVTLQGLGNEGTVNASGKRAAAILGSCEGENTKIDLSYSYTTGTITGAEESAAISGWLGSNSQVTGCYSTATVSGNATATSFAPHQNATFVRCFNNNKNAQAGVTKLSASNVTRGDLCYRLHDHTSAGKSYFFQTLGADDHPVLQHHAEVTRKGTTYVNNMDYEISTAQEFADFAQLVNNGFPTANATITQDLDFKDVKFVTIGSTDSPYCGHVNGMGHTFSNVKITSNENYTGMFRVVGPGANIENFVLDETCSIQGASYTAIVGGTATEQGDVYLTNLGNEGTVKGVKNTGAIFGCEMSSTATVYITNCYSSGVVTGDNESGALCGYIRNGHIKNSWSSAEITGWYTQADKPFALLYCPASNNYCTTGPLNKDFDVQLITNGQVENGELCYVINQNSGQETPIWYQTLGQDKHPVLDSTHGIVEKSENGEYINPNGSGLINIQTDEEGTAYTPQGIRTDMHHSGLHIVRTKSGKAYKVLIK